MAVQTSIRQRQLDPILWPLDTGRLHHRVPSADPNPIIVDGTRNRGPGSRRFNATVAALLVAVAVAGAVVGPAPWATIGAVVLVAAAGYLVWRAVRGPFVTSWVFAEDGVGYQRRDGLVAWVRAERIARLETRVVNSGRYPRTVVRVRDWKKHVLLSAQPGGIDPNSLLRAAAEKGYPVPGHDS